MGGVNLRYGHGFLCMDWAAWNFIGRRIGVSSGGVDLDVPSGCGGALSSPLGYGKSVVFLLFIPPPKYLTPCNLFHCCLWQADVMPHTTKAI